VTGAKRGGLFAAQLQHHPNPPLDSISAESQLHTSPLVGEVGARSAPGEGIGVEDAAGFAFTLTPTPPPSRGRGSKRAAVTHANWVPLKGRA